MVFKATISLQLGVQSHHRFSVWRSKSSFSVSAFRATISPQFWHSEPPSLLSWAFRATISFQFSVQSHYLLATQHSEPSSLLNYDVQSRLSQFDIQRFQFSIMAFKAFIFFSLAFRAAIYSQLRRSELSFSVQRSESSFSVSAFRATISFRFNVRSHHPFSVWVFRATISSQFRHSEPPSVFSLEFRVTIPSQFGIQSHHPIIIRHSLPHFWRSKLHS